MNNKDYLEENKVNGIKLSPSKTKILSMKIPFLIEHYSLIQLKSSSLSSSERTMVNNRIKFHLDKKNISQLDLDMSLTNLKSIIQ